MAGEQAKFTVNKLTISMHVCPFALDVDCTAEQTSSKNVFKRKLKTPCIHISSEVCENAVI